MKPLETHGAGTVLLLAPLGGLALDVAGSLLLARLPLGVGPLRKQFLSFAAGLVATGAAAVASLSQLRPNLSDSTGYAVLALASYGCAGFAFFNLAVSAGVSSVRIRLLRRCLEREPALTPLATLLAEGDRSRLLDARLDRLEAGGQIIRRGGRVYFRPGAVAWIGRLFAALHRLLFGTVP